MPPTLPVDTVLNGTNGSGIRSGARTPLPLTATPKVPPIGSKPVSPTINWPKPGSPARSAGSRRSPKVATPQKVGTPCQPVATNAAVAGSPEPELQRLTATRTPINWPSPKSPAPVKTPEAVEQKA